MRRLCGGEPSSHSAAVTADAEALQRLALNPEDPAMMGRPGPAGWSGQPSGRDFNAADGEDGTCVAHAAAVLAVPLRPYFPLPGCAAEQPFARAAHFLALAFFRTTFSYFRTAVARSLALF